MPDIYLHPHLRAAIGLETYASLRFVTWPDGVTELLALNEWQWQHLLEAEPGLVTSTPWKLEPKKKAPARTKRLVQPEELEEEGEDIEE